MEKTKNMIKIYHNARCSKSCSALAELKQSGEPFELIEYLKDTPSVDELKAIVEKLQCHAHDLIRTNEAVYLQHYKGKNLSEIQWLEAMHENPVLIQRPIIINGNRATIARSNDSIKAAINNL